MDLYGELEWRGLVYDATEGVRDVLAREKVTGYIGFDPTAREPPCRQPAADDGARPSAAARPFADCRRRRRHRADRRPQAEATERPLLSVEKVESNVAGIRAQLARFLDFEARGNPARLVNNADWLTR